MVYTRKPHGIFLFFTSSHCVIINLDNQVLTLCVYPLLQVKAACKTL